MPGSNWRGPSRGGVTLPGSLGGRDPEGGGHRKSPGRLLGKDGKTCRVVLHQDQAVYLTPVVGPAARRETWTPPSETGTTSVAVPLMVVLMSPGMKTGRPGKTTAGCARSWRTPLRLSR